MTIEIEGVKYHRRNEPSIDSNTLSGLAAFARMMEAMVAMPNLSNNGGKQEFRLTTRQLIEQYELIGQKKSNLSSAQRREVVQRFERMFVKTEEIICPNFGQIGTY